MRLVHGLRQRDILAVVVELDRCRSTSQIGVGRKTRSNFTVSISRSKAVAVALAVAVVGCRDTTAPDKPLVVTLTLDAPPTPIISDTPNGPQIECIFDVTATATGNGTATWLDSRTLWYIGPDRSTAVDSTGNPQSEVQGAFGGATIAGGETQHTRWHLYAGAPFEASLGFGYQVTGGQTSLASTRITCGPTPQGAVVPTITQLSVPNMTGEVRVGDTLSVSYQETGSSGVWVTVVDVTGAFKSEQVIGEHLATSVNRVARFVVPNGATPGIPITISVRAFDAALIGSSRSLETQLEYVDRTPPVVSAFSITGRNALSGQYAVGDTISLTVSAYDDAALGSVVYQIGAPVNVRDSLPATPGVRAQSWTINLAVGPTWVGTPTLTAYARDAGGNVSQTVTSQSDSIVFYPIVNRPATTPLSLSSQYGINDIVYDPKHDLMYVELFTDNHIVVFSPTTMTMQAPITLPGAGAGMDVALSGDSLYVTLPAQNEIGVVDLTNANAPLGRIKLSVLDTTALYPGVPVAPTGLRIASNNKMFVMLNNMTAHNDQTVEVDLTTGAQRIRSDARALSTNGPYWTMFSGRTSDRSHLFFLEWTCASRYDASSDTFTTCANGIASDQYGVSVDATGTHIARGEYLLDAGMHIAWTPDAIVHLLPTTAISPDGSTLYLGAGQTLSTARVADHVMLARSSIPISANRVFVSPSGQWALAFESLAWTKVTRIDLQ
jgi:hypothetical protein